MELPEHVEVLGDENLCSLGLRHNENVFRFSGLSEGLWQVG